MSDSKSPLPCPFCGEEPNLCEVRDVREEYKGHVYGYTISCDTCGIEMADEYQSGALEAWNKRTPASVLAANCHDQLVAALKPFAAFCDAASKQRRFNSVPDDTPFYVFDDVEFTYGDLRRARAALALTEPSDG